MRKIVLKTMPDFDYKSLLRSIIATPGPRDGGMALDQVRKAVKILDRLEAADGHLLLEEADWQFMKTRVEGASYTLADKRIVEFADDVIQAPEVNVAEATALPEAAQG